MTKRLILSMVLVAGGSLLPAAVAAQTAGGGSGRGTVPPTFQRPRAELPVSVDPQQWPQAFSVVLVVGEVDGAQAGDTVPAAARRALTDMKDFLPYKSYRLLDSQWTLCCGKGSTFSRLRGLDDQEYELTLTTTLTPTISGGVPGGKATVNVRFLLVEAGGFSGGHVDLRVDRRGTEAVVEAVADAERLMQMEVELRELQRQREQALESRNAQHPEVARLQSVIASLTREIESQKVRRAAAQRSDQARAFAPASRARRQIMDASFRMEVGETVVVGTSRIQGDKALIALLTAVPPKGAAGR